MTDVQTEQPPPSQAQGRNSSVTSSGSISDPSLAQLREQIKTIMIPLLIKVFHLKLEVQQASSPPSRLQSKQPPTHAEEIIGQLEKLDEDLKLLLLWCQSCRGQVTKVLSEAQEELKMPYQGQIHTRAEAHPGVQKSFSDAVASQQESLKSLKPLQACPKEAHAPATEENSSGTKSPWWNRVLRR